MINTSSNFSEPLTYPERMRILIVVLYLWPKFEKKLLIINEYETLKQAIIFESVGKFILIMMH